MFYVSAEQITDSKADILLYRYSFDDNESTLVYRYEIDELEKIRQSHIHIYVLEYDFAIIEEIGQDNEVTNVVPSKSFLLPSFNTLLLPSNGIIL